MAPQTLTPTPASLLGDGGRRGTFGDLDPRPQLAFVRSLIDMCRSSSPLIHTPALWQLILIQHYLALPKLCVDVDVPRLRFTQRGQRSVFHLVPDCVSIMIDTMLQRFRV